MRDSRVRSVLPPPVEQSVFVTTDNRTFTHFPTLSISFYPCDSVFREIYKPSAFRLRYGSTDCHDSVP